jgi:MFS family permease
MGISAEKAAVVLSLIGGSGIAGRVLVGSISDRIGRKVFAIICSSLQVGAMVWLIWTQSWWMFYLFALVYGFAYGGMAPVMTALVSDTLGLPNIGMILGILDIGWGIGAAAGPAVGGLIFDATSSYSIAFALGAAVMLIVTLLIIPIKRVEPTNFPANLTPAR